MLFPHELLMGPVLYLSHADNHSYNDVMRTLIVSCSEGSLKATHHGRSFQVSTSLISPSPLRKSWCLFRNRPLVSNSRGQPRAMTTGCVVWGLLAIILLIIYGFWDLYCTSPVYSTAIQIFFLAIIFSKLIKQYNCGLF